MVLVPFENEMLKPLRPAGPRKPLDPSEENVEEQAPSADDIAEKKPAQKRRRKEDPVTKSEEDKKAREASNKAERDFYRSLLNDEEAFNKAWGPIMEAESKLRTCAPACCGIEFESMASFGRHKQRVHQ